MNDYKKIYYNGMIGIVLSIATNLSVACNYDANKSGLHYFLDMHDSLAVESQEEDYTNQNEQKGRGMTYLSSVSGSNSSMRVPPEGTIARNQEIYPYEASAFNLAKTNLKNPLSLNDSLDNLHRGQKVYNSQCAVCHGYRGFGNGPVSNHFANIPNLQTEIIKNWSDGELFHIITMGRGRMYSFAAQITPEDRWKIILYLRYMQKNVDEK